MLSRTRYAIRGRNRDRCCDRRAKGLRQSRGENSQKTANPATVRAIERTRDMIAKLPRAHELSIFRNVGRDTRIKPTATNDYCEHGERPITALLLTFMDTSEDMAKITMLVRVRPLLKESASRTRGDLVLSKPGYANFYLDQCTAERGEVTIFGDVSLINLHYAIAINTNLYPALIAVSIMRYIYISISAHT